jgi:sodium/potassium/calcium exchanger 6
MAPRALFAAVALLAQATAAAAGQEKMDCGDVWAEVPAGERCAAFAACTGDANAYMNWYSCARTTGARGPLLAAYVVLLCLLFVLLGSTAEEFFAPALEQMSRDMGLPPRFAGVTLLALGNGAPDVSATIAAVTNGGDGYLLSLGALTGAGMFVGTVVAGIVMTIAGGVTARGALVRDVCMYTVTLVVVMTMFISEAW